MENTNYQLTPSQGLSNHIVVGDDVDKGFENFFNNESLSDRTLLICETEKIEFYSGGTDFPRGTKRKNTDLQEDELDITYNKRSIKQEVMDDDVSIDKTHCDLQSMQEIKVEEDYDRNEQASVDPIPVEADVSQIEVDVNVVDHSQVEVIINRSPRVEEEQICEGDGTARTVSEKSPDLPSLDDEIQTDDTNGIEIAEGTEEVPNNTATELVIEEENEQSADSVIEGEMQQENIPQQSTSNTMPKRTYSLETKTLRETRVFVHSIILAAKSDFFKCLFSSSGMKETNQQEVKIEVGRDETDTMLILLRCFYNRNFINQQSLEIVINVCSLAMKYCFDGLIDKCLEVFADRAGGIIDIDDFNRINLMIDKIQSDLNQHSGKCKKVLKKCHTFLINSFKNLDECFETQPCKLFQLRLEAMNLFLDPYVQAGLNNPHGNLFLYAMQRWLRNHQICYNLNCEDSNNKQMRQDTFTFIEKLLNTVSLTNVTSDFLTNVMNHEISPFNIWSGYKEWYIRALQNHIFQNINHNTGIKTYPVLNRQREMKYIRQEKNADIFSMPPVILNGFEIGIYLRVREDRKLHLLCKCKNLISNKVGFDKAVLSFTIKGMLKLNTNSTLWKEPFPRQFSSHPAAAMFTDRFAFSYKQNTMCLQMYSLCRLSPAVYNIAKRHGFFIDFDIQYIH